MSITIRAAVAHGNQQPLQIEDIDLVEPSDHEVIVKLVATGLCHTDLMVLDSVPLPWPAVLGHEGAGVIERVGTAVKKVAVGDHVLMAPSSCGHCKNCIEGQQSYCFQFREINMSGGYNADGSCSHTRQGKPVFARFLGQSSFASHALLTERNVIKIDHDLPLDVMAPLSCGIQTGVGAVFNNLQPKPGSSIAIFGAGAVGLSALMAAKISGCSQIIAIDQVDSRLALARELGATDVVNAKNENSVEKVIALTGGADYTVEASGVSAVMEQAVASLGFGGTAVLVGIAGGEPSVSFNPTELQAKGLTIKGSLMAGENSAVDVFIPQLIAYWREGRLPFEKLVRYYEFDQINQAISDARDGSVIKPVLRFPQ